MTHSVIPSAERKHSLNSHSSRNTSLVVVSHGLMQTNWPALAALLFPMLSFHETCERITCKVCMNWANFVQHRTAWFPVNASCIYMPFVSSAGVADPAIADANTHGSHHSNLQPHKAAVYSQKPNCTLFVLLEWQTPPLSVHLMEE